MNPSAPVIIASFFIDVLGKPTDVTHRRSRSQVLNELGLPISGENNRLMEVAQLERSLVAERNNQKCTNQQW
jgi:hypothetical protein